jgi:ribosomal protein L27
LFAKIDGIVRFTVKGPSNKPTVTVEPAA